MSQHDRPLNGLFVSIAFKGIVFEINSRFYLLRSLRFVLRWRGRVVSNCAENYDISDSLMTDNTLE